MSAAHTVEFIAAMKAKLEQERETLQQELSSVAHKQAGEYQADFPEYGRDEEDNATEVADFVAAAATTDAAGKRLREVEAALERIGIGTYGVTADGELIPEARLQANPAATTLVK